MRHRGSVAIERLRRRGRLFARDLRLGHIGPGRRWPPYLRSAAITLILALATALVVAQNFLPNRLNLRAGDVSSQDIVSQRSLRYESQTKRDEARAVAAAQVPDQFDGSVSSQQRQAIDTLATKVAELRRSSSSGPDRSAQLSLLEPELKRKEARNAVPPVFVTVAPGQTIIRYGGLVTPFQLEEAQAVGLLAPKTDWARIMAVFMLVIILFAVALGYLMQFRPAILRDPRQLATLGGLMLGLLVVAKVIVPINANAQYLVPMVAVPLLVSALL